MKDMRSRSSYDLLITFVFMTLLSCINCGLYDGFSDDRPYTVRTTRFLCDGEESLKLSVINECRIKLLRNGSSLVTFNYTVLQPLHRVYLTLKIWYKTSSNVFTPLLGIDEKMDLCELMQNKTSGNPLINVAYKLAKQYSLQFVRPCPILGTYAVINYMFEDSMFPPFLPAGDYRNDMRLIRESNETLLGLHFYGSVRAKGIADLRMG